MPSRLTDRLTTALESARPIAERARRAAADAQRQSWTRRAAVGIAATRVVLGCAALTLPGPAGRAWIGQGATGRDRAVLVRALGGRDVALGAGALLALRSGGDIRRWLVLGATSDAVDAAASAAGFGALPRWRRWLVLAASGGTAGAGLLLAASFPARS
ncbi:MAG TPA: hypothetical protein VND62_02665 [Acidimicrobiales bacterium]|nr:hypothetical protein [Acidimicrobiales bacterium]